MSSAGARFQRLRQIHRATLSHRAGSRGLRDRLAMVVAGVLLLPVALAVAQAYWARGKDEERQRITLERTLEVIASHQEQVLGQAIKSLLGVTGRGGAGVDDELASTPCGPVDALVAQQNPIFWALLRTDATGQVTCRSAKLPGIGDDLSSLPSFQRLAGGKMTLTASGVRHTPSPDHQRTIYVAAALGGPDARFAGMLLAALELDPLIALPKSAALPDDAIAAVVDDSGNVATARGLAEGDQLDSATIQALLLDPRSPQFWDDPRGRSWRFILRPTTAEGIRTSVLVGLPARQWDWLDAQFQLAVLLPTSILLLSVFAVWVATDRMVTQPILALARAVRRWRREGQMPELDLAAAPDEITELGAAFGSAARTLKERDLLLRRSLDEKDLLLREIHHRVKNNLQVVTSLLNLRAAGLRNDEARRAMREAQYGIKALALVHRKLYERPDMKLVELNALLEELCPLVHEVSEDIAERVRLTLTLEPVVVNADQATAVALLTTELLTNAVKHAFPDGRHGEIRVELAPIGDGQVRLVIMDNGVGFVEDEDSGFVKGLGSQLVGMFARQLGGSFQRRSDGEGVRAELVFLPKLTDPGGNFLL